MSAAVVAMPAGAATVTVAPSGPADTHFCVPFALGSSTSGDAWTPYMGFVYKNVPTFALAPGDTLAFDTTKANDTDIHLDVALAATASNGAPDPVGSFTQVVSNSETPSSPRGDNTASNFDLKFTAQAPFAFPGGGLVIRFSNPGGAFASDSTCDGGLGGASASDASGFFVQRFNRDLDGTYPWDNPDTDGIGSFQMVNASVIAPPPPSPPDTTKPLLGSLVMSATVFRAAKSGPSASAKKKPVGTKVRFTLSEPGAVKFTVERKTRGRKVGKRCKAQTKANRKKKACDRWVKVKGSFTRAGKAGMNSFKFRGRIGGKRLKPGRYRLDGQATDPAKNKSTLKRKSFKIVR